MAAALPMGAIGAFHDRWGSRIELTVDLGGSPTTVRGSVGTAVVPPYEVDSLLSLADKARYDVKRASGHA